MYVCFVRAAAAEAERRAAFAAASDPPSEESPRENRATWTPGAAPDPTTAKTARPTKAAPAT